MSWKASGLFSGSRAGPGRTLAWLVDGGPALWGPSVGVPLCPARFQREAASDGPLTPRRGKAPVTHRPLLRTSLNPKQGPRSGYSHSSCASLCGPVDPQTFVECPCRRPCWRTQSCGRKCPPQGTLFVEMITSETGSTSYRPKATLRSHRTVPCARRGTGCARGGGWGPGQEGLGPGLVFQGEGLERPEQF